METYTFDASKEPLGRMASRIAVLLMGKHRPSFKRHVKTPPRVIVAESDRLVLTGRKGIKKTYYRHSGYLGHLREFSADQMRRRDSREMVRRAVSGMLPKNKLRKQLLKQLIIYKESSPREGQKILDS